MSFKKGAVCFLYLLMTCVALADIGAVRIRASTQAGYNSAEPPEIAFIAPEQLKAKLAKNEPLTIIDVRSANDFIGSDGKIKGAIYVKSRRLHARLGLAPLKDVSRDQEVVTYCA